MKDLKIPRLFRRTTKGMQDCFILVLVYSYLNTEYIDSENSFILPESLIAEMYNKSTRSVIRWFKKLRELGYLNYTKREDAGEVAHYSIKDKVTGEIVTKSYIKGERKKKVVRDSKGNLKYCLNIYQLDQNGLNDYLIEHVNIDVLNNIEEYKHLYDEFMHFIKTRKEKMICEEIVSKKKVKNSKITDKDRLRYKKLLSKQTENALYIKKKNELDSLQPEFTCKYLDDGCFRLTHDICNTINPEHTEKINENNYWRSSDCRINMLRSILHTNKDNIVEYDVNGSIYRLTYNLYHDKPLSDDVDIYELIWNNCNFGIDFNSTHLRNAFKSIIMPIYMKCSTISYKASQWEHIQNHMKYKDKNILSKVKYEFYSLYKSFVELTHKSIKSLLETIKNALFKTLNISKSLGADIFIHESNLHILIREKLLKRGIHSANVYDGFYFDKNTISEDEFYSIYREATIELKNNLSLGIGTPIPA